MNAERVKNIYSTHETLILIILNALFGSCAFMLCCSTSGVYMYNHLPTQQEPTQTKEILPIFKYRETEIEILYNTATSTQQPIEILSTLTSPPVPICSETLIPTAILSNTLSPIIINIPPTITPNPPTNTPELPTQTPEPPIATSISCDPSYPGVCIPPPPPDLNCPDITYRNFTVLLPDPHNLDGNDKDGIGCEE